MNIAVVGCGPVGAMAAWAAIQYGYDVTVYDRDPSKISIGKAHGVFALWSDCDLFLSQKQMVKVGVIGGKGLKPDERDEAYAKKVYGNPSLETSIEKYCNTDAIECYNHAEAYQQIIDILGFNNIKQLDIPMYQEIDNLLDGYDIVINTLPANFLWPNKEWPNSEAYIYHAAAPIEDAFMIYNVNQYISWYRCSAIFGKFSMEYTVKPDDDKKYVKVTKVLLSPQSPDDLTSDKIWNVGRFGAWEKECLTEDVYYNVLKRFSDLSHPKWNQINIARGDYPLVR